jgi:2-dehydro-3-deoxyphosphogluconate aldolase/(4S)-4-hydroxy-2-oxoglutarate aldolase
MRSMGVPDSAGSNRRLADRLGSFGLVPVITIRRADDAAPLGEALAAGGLPLAEITFRTDAAERAIEVLRLRQPGMLIGAGTVLTIETVRRAVGAGAEFVVAPGFNPAVVDHCGQNGIPVIPGVSSPTDIEMGLTRGLDLLKFFPAEACGGLAFLDAIAAPYGDVKFMPTGGINLKNLPTYLGSNRVVACGGSWIAPIDVIAEGRFDEIEDNVRQSVTLVRSLRPPAADPT